MNAKIEGHLSALVHPAPVSIERKASGASAGCAQSIPPVRASDSLRLTGEAAGLQVLQRELTNAPAVDTTRVEAVRAELAAGTYRIDPEQIAARMLEFDALLAPKSGT